VEAGVGKGALSAGRRQGAASPPPNDAADEPPAPAGPSYVIRGRLFAAPRLEPGLYVVATPIGHLADVTVRALDTLAAAHLLACEDTRVTRKLLDRYGIRRSVVSHHEHSGPAAHARVLAALGEGKAVALVSDAGTPLVSDPGARLVADALAAGHRVVPIPGASAAVTALSAAGLPAETFLFLGFLPAKSAARRRRLAEIAAIEATLVLYESPNRIGALLADAAATLGAERAACVCRELTKLHEIFDRGALGALAARYAERATKGEIVLLVGPPGPAATPTPEDVDAQLHGALATKSVREAAASVSAATGLSRRDLYARALKLKEATGGAPPGSSPAQRGSGTAEGGGGGE
jgi:16S rRNA (cytidine1402-2'-O)-methyltransferase